MPRNIELKARLRDPTSATATAQRIATEDLGPQHQIDTYFVVPHGRLKLREIDGSTAQLVWYRRENTTATKGSDYELTSVPDPASLKRSLAGALGILTVVDKRRHIWLWHNVRIHLDEVQGLGHFLEFEAVLDETHDDADGHAALAQLIHEFGLTPADLLPASYSDMLLARP